MTDDPRVLTMGEDIAALGGVFRVTDGLLADFGEDRVIDTPLSESTIVGAAIGLAMRGYRAVCEIQFDGFVYPAFNQIVAHLAKYRYRSRGQISMSVVIRIPYGGGIKAAEHHSESPEAYFAHTPGLNVFTPSTPSDAYGLLREAIRMDDPVIFFEPKHDYWLRAEVDTSSNFLGAGVAQTIRRGDRLTLVGYGPSIKHCLQASRVLEDDGVSIEVIDLRTLVPLDIHTITESVSRTGRLVVAHEAPKFCGFGAELVSQIVQSCFGYLVAPPTRVASFSTPYPAAALEDAYLPSVDQVVDAVDECLRWK